MLRHELSDAAHHLEELTDQLQQHQVVGVGGAGRSGELQGRVTQLERALEAEREQRRQVHSGAAMRTTVYVVLVWWANGEAAR